MARETLADKLKRYRAQTDLAEKWRREEGLDALWQRLRDLYRLRSIPKGLSTEDRIHIAVAFATVNAIAPSVAVNTPKMTVNARQPEFDAMAEIIETVVNYWFRHLDLTDELRLTVKDSIIFGHGWAKVTWLQRTEQQDIHPEKFEQMYSDRLAQADEHAAQNPDNAANLPSDDDIYNSMPTGEEVVTEDRPKVERVSPFDMFVDPEATSLRNAKYIIQRIIRPLEDAQSDPMYEKATAKALKGSSALKDKFLPRKTGADDTVDRQGAARVVIYEHYDLTRGTLCVYADEGDGFLVKPREMPYPFGHPFLFLPNYEVPDYFYPIGDLEALEPLQKELDKTRSQMMNHRKRYARKYLAKKEAFDQKARNALSSERDGEVILVNDGTELDEAIKPLDQVPLPPEAYNYSDIIANDLDRVSGVNEYMRGQLPEIRRTATEASIIQDAANSRAADKLSRVEKFYAQVAAHMVSLAQTFMASEQVVRVAGRDGEQYWLQFEPEDIQGEHDFEVEAGSTQPQNDSVKRQQVLQMLQVMGPFIGTVLDPHEMARYALQEGFGVKNPERFMIPPMVDPMTGQPVPPGGAPGPGGPGGPPPGPDGPEVPNGGVKKGPQGSTRGVPPAVEAQLQGQVGLTLGR
jgi:hypothetical protein